MIDQLRLKTRIQKFGIQAHHLQTLEKNLILNRGLIDYHGEPWYSKMFSASSSKTVVIGGVDFNGSVSGGFLILEGLRARSRFVLIKFYEIE